MGIVEIISGVVSVIGLAFGIFTKIRAGQLVKELFDVLKVIKKAREDGTVTLEEYEAIYKEIEDVLNVGFKFFRKG